MATFFSKPLSFIVFFVLVLVGLAKNSQQGSLEARFLRDRHLKEKEVTPHALESRIIGGEQEPVNRYRYMAALTTGGSFFCGGSLIAPNVVLTAGHCAEVLPDAVILNCSDLLQAEDGCESVPVIDQFIFPDYNPSTLENDFAVLILGQNTSSDTVALAPPEFILPDGQDHTATNGLPPDGNDGSRT